MQLSRTVVFSFYPSKEQEIVLIDTLNLYNQAWQHCVDVAWTANNLSPTKIHKATYSFLKNKLKLKSQFLCSARNRAIESVKSAKDRFKKKKKVSKPQSSSIPIRLDARTISFDKTKETASITTQHKRIKIKLHWHKQAHRYKEWDLNQAGEITLNRKGQWVLRLLFTKEQTTIEKSGYSIGVDRGINHPIVSSDNRFIGNPKWKVQEEKLLLLKSQLQSKGTKSAKRHLKKLSGRLRRFKTDCDRVMAKALLNPLSQGDTVVLEDLTKIKNNCGKKGKANKTQRIKMGRWSFKRVEKAISYYAEVKNVFVESINPQYTSQECSKCHKIEKLNRKGNNYTCSCGCSLNADLNAARNINFRWYSASGIVPRLPVNQPIVGNFVHNIMKHNFTHKPSTLVEGY